MKGFSEAWLRDYLGKQASQPRAKRVTQPASPVPVLVAPQPTDVITFTLSRPTITLNEYLRMHWTKRSTYQRDLSDAIGRRVLAVPCRPPLQRAIVTITRHSLQQPDDDGLHGGFKPLLDCLLVKSDRHPHGLGFIVDDSPQHILCVPVWAACATRKEQRTVVVIEPWSETVTAPPASPPVP